jgi:regulatory protein
MNDDATDPRPMPSPAAPVPPKPARDETVETRSRKPALPGAAAGTRRAGVGLSLKGRALRLLAAREYSRPELERKLQAHEEAPGQLAAVLDDLQAKDFINEARVVESVINRRAGRFGAPRIRQELLQKGLGAERVQQAVQTLKATEFERARAVWERKYSRQGDPPADAASRARQMRFLAARGFAADVIARVVTKGGRQDSES